MSIQILQYEFLGPVRLDEWGPPMEKVVYLIFSRKKDSFIIIYVGDCEKTDKDDFFENNPKFETWIQITGSKDSIYLAILPMFESNPSARKAIVNKIIHQYHPVCNADSVKRNKPDYIIRSKPDLASSNNPKKNLGETTEKTLCPCCGFEMKVDKVLENTTVLKCTGCSLTDTRLNS